MFCFASLCFYIIKIVLTCAVYNFFFDSFLSLFASSSTQKLCINSIVPYLLCSILILFSFELSRMDFYMCFFLLLLRILDVLCNCYFHLHHFFSSHFHICGHFIYYYFFLSFLLFSISVFVFIYLFFLSFAMYIIKCIALTVYTYPRIVTNYLSSECFQLETSDTHTLTSF